MENKKTVKKVISKPKTKEKKLEISREQEMVMAFGQIYISGHEQAYARALELLKLNPDMNGHEAALEANRSIAISRQVQSMQVAPGVVAMSPALSGRSSPNPMTGSTNPITTNRPHIGGVHSIVQGTNPGSKIGDAEQFATNDDPRYRTYVAENAKKK